MKLMRYAPSDRPPGPRCCALRSGSKTGSNPARSSTSNVSIVANTGSNRVRSRRMKAWSIGCSPVPRRAFLFPLDQNRPTRCEISGRRKRPQRADQKAPNVEVVEWLRHNEREIAVDPIILGELRFGIPLPRN